MNRILNLIKCLVNSSQYCLIVLYYRIIKKVPNKLSLNILSPKETLDILKNSNKSLIRFSDGEIQLMLGLNIGYQKYSSQLKKDLIEILKDNDKRLLIGLHGFVNKTDNYINLVGGRSGAVKNIKILLPYFINKNIIYGDTLTFYTYTKENDYHKVLDLIEGKDVLLITNKQLSDEILKKNIFSSVNSINCFCVPSQNSYEFLINNLNNILFELNNYSNVSNIRILLGGGPGSKIIGYKLMKKGYICYDVGNWLTAVSGIKNLGLSISEVY